MIRARPLAAAPDDPDWQLVAAARAGDEAAIRELVRRMNPRLFRIARGILPSDAEAEEAVQDAYLAAFTHLDSFRGEARFSTWISRIAINAARMQARRPRPDRDHAPVNDDLAASADVLAFPGAETAETDVARHQVRALLEETLARLPPELRLPFLLHEVEGQPVLAIAHDLGLNPITVRTRLFRARRQLRRALEVRLRGGFDAVFPFDGARCARMADRVVVALRGRP
ncbi:RNA polymerase sigma factor [Paracoccus simplex]|uniref:RNA polymerase sigma factor n=1 Tax=Paracoccus simplex TaxID=2086346 RepID=A0ABV7RVC4_9RHOB